MRKILCAICLLFLVLPLTAQTLGTGNYPFSTLDSRGFDSINVGNLNVRFTIPIVSRTGRGTPFNYALQYEGLIWSNAGGAWTPDPSWGMTGVLNGTAFAGYMTHHRYVYKCVTAGSRYQGSYFQITDYVYHDAFGTPHRFDAAYTSSCPDGSGGNDDWTGDGTADDNSGYYLDLDDTTVVHTRSGSTIRPALSPTGQDQSSITDSNGNQITGDGAGNFTDTLGATALSISGTSPRVFTYPVTRQANGATTASTTLSYQTYTVRTNFQCGGIADYGSNSVSLPDRVTFADGTYYAFTYEATPGTSSGEVTGRLASITLPTGGVISYSYTSGCGGGINADGTVGILTRTTSDGTRQYNRLPINGNATSTDLVDENGNDTRYVFSIDSATQRFLETHRQVHQGDLNGPVLMEQFTCYNGTAAPCDGGNVTLPISRAGVILSYNGGTQTFADNTYDPNGTLLTSSTLNDGSGHKLMSTSNTYDGQGNLTDTANSDAAGNVYTYTYFRYDEGSVTPTSNIPQHTSASGPRGNLTSIHTSAATPSQNRYLETYTTYYDTGQPVNTTAADGGVTTYSYDATGAFAASTTLPISGLTTSALYDATSASLLSSTGLNSGETITVNQYDALMRPRNVTLPGGSTVIPDYDGARHSAVYRTLDAQRTAVVETLLDEYGRRSRVNQANGQAVNGWYQTDFCYGSTGLLKFQSSAYQSTGLKDANGNDTAKHCSGSGTSYTYDALGRVTAVANDDGTATTQYSGRAVKTTDVNGVMKITQYDLQGRVSGVCELSGSSLGNQSPVDCGMDISGSGYLTSYTYNPTVQNFTVTQGNQARTFQTDAAGRTIAVSEPERGTTIYDYAFQPSGLQVTRSRSRANQSDPNVKTSTVTQYDLLGRVTQISYNDGVTKNKYFQYDATPSWLGWSASTANTKGRLAGNYSDWNTRAQYSYDAAGNVVDLWQCAPSICGGGNQESRPTLHYTYDLSGAVISAFDGASGNIVYTRSVAGEITSVSNGTYTDAGNTPSLMTNVTNGPYGPYNWSLGNGLTGVNNIDSMGRVAGSFVCIGSNQPYCSGGSVQRYGNALTWKGTRVTGLCDTVLNQCESHGYDEFNRLTAVNSGGTSYSYGYDRWGNRTSANGVGYSYDGSNRQVGLSYDAAGNQTSDGIHSYTYDAEGKVLRVDGGTTASYAYDALDQRVRATTQSFDVEYLFDPFGRKQSSWTVSNNFGSAGRIYWDGGLLAHRGALGQTFFHHGNYLGTERLRTNYQGQPTSTAQSGPYGENLNEQANSLGATSDERSQYTGQEHDDVTGTDHFLFRQYQSLLGRWMSPDPYDGSYSLNPQSLNRYAYVLGNPFGFLDLYGLDYLCAPVWEDTYDGDGGVITTKTAELCVDEGSGGGGGGFVEAAGGGGGGGGSGNIPGVSRSYDLNNACTSALAAANRSPAGVARANSAWSTLQGAADANGIPTALLASIGVRESNFMNVQETLQGGDAGPGMGVFQLTNQRGVSAAQAFNLTFSANYAARLLSSNMKSLSRAFSFTPAQLLQATAASYNFGIGNISGNSKTIDVGSTGGNYGSTVVGMMGCFSHP